LPVVGAAIANASPSLGRDRPGTSCKNFGFFFHVIDALYYSVVNVHPAVSRLPGRGVQFPELTYPRVERLTLYDLWA